MYNLKIRDYGSNGLQLNIYRYSVREVSPSSPSHSMDNCSYLGVIDNPFDYSPSYAFQELSDDQIARNRSRSLSNSIKRTKDSIINISRSVSDWKYFVTFTFSPDFVDRYDYSAVSKLMSRFLNNISHKFDNLKYIVVPELHKDGAFHFHGLFSDLNCSFSGHYTSSGDHIFNVSDFPYGFSTATVVRSVNSSCGYIIKYISKDLASVSSGKRRYWYSHSTINVVSPYTYQLTPDEILTLIKNIPDSVFSRNFSNSFCDLYSLFFTSDNIFLLTDFLSLCYNLSVKSVERRLHHVRGSCL